MARPAAPSIHTPTALTARSDGLTSVTSQGHLVVYGGAVADKVWLLSLSRRTWSEATCTGAVPPARLHHTAVLLPAPSHPDLPPREEMVVFGGVLVDPAAGAGGAHCYALDLHTFSWRVVRATGDAPDPRSHHTAVALGGRMLLYGGRSTKRGQGKDPTAAELAEDKRSGFFDVHSLDCDRMEWARVERYDPRAPMLWGHSACVFRHFMLVYGGFDVADTSARPAPGRSAPSATLSDVVHIWDAERCEWSRASPHPGQPRPVCRALHNAVVCHDQLFIFGGLTVDQHGRPTSVQDSWAWDIARGHWQKVPFAVPHWGGRRPLGAPLGDGSSVVVCTDLAECHFLDFAARDRQWRSEPCDPSALFRRPADVSPQPAPQQPQMLQPPPQPQPSPRRADLPYVSPLRAQSDTGGELLPSAPEARPAPAVDPREAERAADRRRQEELHALAHRAEQQRHIDMLQKQVQALRGQVEEMRTLQTRIARDEAAGSPEVSPARQDARAGDIAKLQELLARLQQQQLQLQQEHQRRHREQLEEISERHEELLAELRRQQQEQLETAQRAAELQAREEQAERHAEQLRLLREQHEQLQQLQQRAAAPPAPAPRADPPAPADPVLPEQIRSMAGAIQRLQQAASRPHVPAVSPQLEEEVARLADTIARRGAPSPAPADAAPGRAAPLAAPPRPQASPQRRPQVGALAGTPPQHQAAAVAPQAAAVAQAEAEEHKRSHLRQLQEQLAAIAAATAAATAQYPPTQPLPQRPYVQQVPAAQLERPPPPRPPPGGLSPPRSGAPLQFAAEGAVYAPPRPPQLVTRDQLVGAGASLRELAAGASEPARCASHSTDSYAVPLRRL